MKPPVQPKQEDCCGSGCNPCIFDVYEKKLSAYKLFIENGELVDDEIENGILQLDYSPFTLEENIELCESHRLLKFKLLSENINARVWWKPGDHFLFKYVTEDHSCSRAYTPLSKYLWTNKQISCEKNEFLIIIKKYNEGLVSNHLFNLFTGQTALWRGPYGQYEVKPNKFKRIIMIAQGTGITPCATIIEKILNNEDDMTKIILYYCSKSTESILLRHELYSFQSYWNFTYKIFVHELVGHIKYNEPIENVRLNEENLSSLCPFSENDQFLLCGSSLFMNTYKNILLLSEAKDLNIVTF